jgi:hypothetical protein
MYYLAIPIIDELPGKYHKKPPLDSLDQSAGPGGSSRSFRLVAEA